MKHSFEEFELYFGDFVPEPAAPERTSPKASAIFSPEQSVQILRLLSSRKRDYDLWSQLLRVIHEVTGGMAVEEFITWNLKNEQYAGHENKIREHWNSYTAGQPNNAGLGSLIEILIKEGADIGALPDDILNIFRGNPKREFAHVRETGLRTLDFSTLLSLKIPPREKILDPIIQTESTSMLFAPRGTGKSFFAMGKAAAIASGGSFLKWKAPKPRRVVFVDAEMPLSDIQNRIPLLFKNRDFDPDFFRYINLLMQLRPFPCLTTEDAQKLIEDELDGVEFLVLDNLSTLVLRGKENEAESWAPVQEWLLSLRRQKVSVLLIHHAGRNGEARGTSKREDILDLVMTLRRPKDYAMSQGLRCEVEFTKARGLYGQDAEPFEVHLNDVSGEWIVRSIDESQDAQICKLQSEGFSIREIAKELGVTRYRVETVLKFKGQDFGLSEVSGLSD